MLIVVDEIGRVDWATEKLVKEEIDRVDPDFNLTTPVWVTVNFKPMCLKRNPNPPPNREPEPYHDVEPDGHCAKCGRLWGDHSTYRGVGCKFYPKPRGSAYVQAQTKPQTWF
jgi:hypothetical protein